DIALDHLLVDNAAMQLVRDPRAFDVILTENMFGDILSDEAAMVTGTIGTAASASLSGAPDQNGFGLYEPISGTAPDIAGKHLAPTEALLAYDVRPGAGGAPRMVLLHSLAMDRHVWDGVVAELAGSVEILTVDCRGHGASTAPAGPYTLARFADDLAGVLDDA